jgi:hypothetical protein
MSSSDREVGSLSGPQRTAILELGSRGSGGQFDVAVMCELMTLGFVEIRSQDRRLMLTEKGRRTYAALSKKHPGE